MRSILSTLTTLLLTAVLYLFAPLVLIGIAAVLLLAVGALLTRWFAVTTFEATLITTLVAIPLLWLYYRLLGRANLLLPEATEEKDLRDEPEDIEPIIILPHSIPRRKKRRQK